MDQPHNRPPECPPEDTARQRPIDRLLEIMERLRAPGGCPWDREQSFETIAPYTIEEAYEVDDAIRSGDREALKDELGDLLLQVVFHAQMAREEGSFAFDDVATAISDKMVRRHPHVFGDGDADTGDAVRITWEEIKAAERAEKASDNVPSSALDGVGSGFPALTRAEKLQKRAARVGFDWDNAGDVVGKIKEEIDEVTAEAGTGDFAKLEEEIGDVLFVIANWARHFKVDPETALRKANAKFERRFRAMEALARDRGIAPVGDLATYDALWNEVKVTEKGKGG
ncbi:MAG: nucleoside triphosphate pyrophosphohydrolase [Alphaproteobacteria bacterium]|nr:nucleoside triphosphate pyrophosphohydrolase [Alphaproteobacteria bacterium]